MSSPVFDVSDFNLDILKQNISSGNHSKFLQYNGMTQLLSTATRIDHKIHNFLSDNPDCGVLDSGFNDHCNTFKKRPFSSKKNDYREFTSKKFLLV